MANLPVPMLPPKQVTKRAETEKSQSEVLFFLITVTDSCLYKTLP